jgi:hypothetical protein
VVGRIIPFNHPIMFAAGKIAAPLVAGNAVILKPPDAAPLSALRMGELLASCSPGAANLAIGVHNAHAESIPSKTLSIEFGPGHPCQHSVAGSDQDAATSGPSSARGAGGAVYLWAVLGAGPFRFRVGVLTAAQPVASDCARGEHPDAGREQAHERRHPGG